MTYKGPLRWNAVAGRFRDALGRFVSFADVDEALTVALASASAEALASTAALRAGTLPLAAWQRSMQEAIKATHLVSASLAHGGLNRIDGAALARIRATIRAEFGYLDVLARQVAAGTQPLDGRLAARARMYLRAGRMTFTTERREVLRADGFDQERNRKGTLDNCDGCVRETARGWVPLGSLVPVGTRDCKRNCRCRVEFRRTADGATREA